MCVLIKFLCQDSIYSIDAIFPVLRQRRGRRKVHDYFLLLLCKSSIWFTEKHNFKIIIYYFNTSKGPSIEVYDGFIGQKDVEAMKAGKMTILPWLSSQYNKNMLVDLPSFVGKGISSLKFHQMSTSSIKVYQCMHSPYFYCVWMKSQGRKSKKLYFLSHQSKYCYIYYNFVHIYETLGISTSQPHHSRQLIVLAHSPRSILSIIFDSVTQKLHFKV